MALLKGKRAIIFGVLNTRSLAYHIAKMMQEAGADIAISYQHPKMAKRVQLLAQQLNASFCYPCDVTKDEDIDTLFTQLNTQWDKIDILVHSVAFSPKAELSDDYLSSTTREGFRITHEVSSYSLTALVQKALPMLRPKSAILTLSYLGAEKAITHYNVMGLAKASLESSVRYLAKSLGPLGIRINALSPSPMHTLSASGIKNFNNLRVFHHAHAPLHALPTPEDIGKTAVCLCSDWMGGVTGEILHVDGGFHAITPFL